MPQTLEEKYKIIEEITMKTFGKPYSNLNAEELKVLEIVLIKVLGNGKARGGIVSLNQLTQPIGYR